MRTIRSNPETVPPPMGTYAHAVRVETAEATWISVSGQLANDADGDIVGIGKMRTQTERVFEHLRAILEANGATFDDVVKITTFVTSMKDLAGVREVRGRYLTGPPTSTLVQVTALAHPDAMIEVELVAVVPSERAGPP